MYFLNSPKIIILFVHQAFFESKLFRKALQTIKRKQNLNFPRFRQL